MSHEKLLIYAAGLGVNCSAYDVAEGGPDLGAGKPQW